MNVVPTLVQLWVDANVGTTQRWFNLIKLTSFMNMVAPSSTPKNPRVAASSSRNVGTYVKWEVKGER